MTKRKKEFVLPKPDPAVRAAREAAMEEVRRNEELVTIASMLMHHARISSQVTEIPEWLLPVAKWSERTNFHWQVINSGDAACSHPEYHRLTTLIRERFIGTPQAVLNLEMWLLAHEDD